MNLDKLGSKSSSILYTEHELVKDYVYRELASRAGTKRKDVIVAQTDKQAREIFSYQGLDPLEANKWFFHIETARISTTLLNPLIKMAEMDDSGMYLFDTSTGRDFFRVREQSSSQSITMFIRSYSREDVYAITKSMGMEPQVVEALARGYRMDLRSPFDLKEKMDEGFDVKTQRDVTKLLGVSSMMTSRTVFEMLNPIKNVNMRLKRVIPSLLSAEEKVGAYNYRKTLAGAAKEYFDLRLLMHMGKIYKTLPDKLPPGFDHKRLVKHRYLLESGRLEEVPLVRVQRMWLELTDENVWYTRQDMLEWVYRWFS